MIGFRGDKPLLAELVLGKIVNEHHVVDAHAHLGEGLGRGDAKSSNKMCSSRGEPSAFGDSRLTKISLYWAAGQQVILPSRNPCSCEVDPNTRVEGADITIVHEVEVALHRFGQLLGRGVGPDNLRCARDLQPICQAPSAVSSRRALRPLGLPLWVAALGRVVSGSKWGVPARCGAVLPLTGPRRCHICTIKPCLALRRNGARRGGRMVPVG